MSKFSRILTWPITAAFLVVCVVFSVNNQQPVTVDLWPLALSYTAPFYLMVLLLLFVGFMIGAAIMWLSDGKVRDKARRNQYKASDLEREVTWLKRKQAQTEAQAAAAQAADTRAQDPARGPASRVPVSGALPGTAERG